MAHETSAGCSFTTDRLVVGDWRRLGDDDGLDLVEVVCEILTRRTTAELPPDWHGDFDEARATRWIAARDAESPTLLVVERQSRQGVGLVILFDVANQQDPSWIDVRLGYVLAESAWGRGLATEVVAGLVAWAESNRRIGSLSGGVAAANAASIRVLTRNGFELCRTENGQHVFERSTR